MRDTYSYLRDPRALAEIRKHKWLESQKAGREIGFATAAVDWIKKFGQEWKRIHLEEYRDNGIFLERRRYRRFKLDGTVELIRDDISIFAEPRDLSFFGILCSATEYLPSGSEVMAHALIELRNHKKNLDCCGIIERAIAVDSKRYELFFKFDKACQQKIGNLGYIV